MSKRCFYLIASTADEMAYTLLSEPRQNWATDLQSLRERPILRLSPDECVCPDFGLLYRCLTDRIYYLLQRCYPAESFSSLFGYIFEQYVNTIFRQFTSESDVLERTFYASPRFEGTQSQAGDGILHWGDLAVLMECRPGKHTRERYSGIEQVLMTGIDDIIGKEGTRNKKGVRQLAANLKKILAGDKIVAGSPQKLDLSKCSTIIPMLVTYEDAVALEAVRQHAELRFTESLQKQGVESSQIGPLLIFSVHDVELLETLATKRPAKELVASYAKHVRDNPKDRIGNFRTFAATQGWLLPAKTNDGWIVRSEKRIRDEWHSELKRRNALGDDGTKNDPAPSDRIFALSEELAMPRTDDEKKVEMMTYLHEHVFDPVLNSPEASKSLKQGVRLTIMRMEDRDATGMLQYYWSAIQGTDKRHPLPRTSCRKEGYARFEEL